MSGQTVLGAALRRDQLFAGLDMSCPSCAIGTINKCGNNLQVWEHCIFQLRFEVKLDWLTFPCDYA
jgi:hypothetical protein